MTTLLSMTTSTQYCYCLDRLKYWAMVNDQHNPSVSTCNARLLAFRMVPDRGRHPMMEAIRWRMAHRLPFWAPTCYSKGTATKKSPTNLEEPLSWPRWERVSFSREVGAPECLQQKKHEYPRYRRSDICAFFVVSLDEQRFDLKQYF